MTTMRGTLGLGPSPAPDTLTRSLGALPDFDGALCAQADPDEWFPDKGESNATAKAICTACPVINECLDYALTNNEQWGIYGGLSHLERRALMKEAS